MRIDERQRAKLNRVLGYGGVAIVVVWTITAIALAMIALLMLAALGSYFRNRRRVATVAQSGESDSPEPLVADDSGG